MSLAPIVINCPMCKDGTVIRYVPNRTPFKVKDICDRCFGSKRVML